MGMLKFSYPRGYAAKFGVAVQPPDALYPDDLYPEETLEKFRKQGVIITPVADPQSSATVPAAVAEPSSPAPLTPGAGENETTPPAGDAAKTDPSTDGQEPPAAGPKKAGRK